jgi:type I restriction enzyme S subunit
MHTLHARQKERKLIIGFAGHLFMSEGIRKQIQREAQGAKVLGISSTRLSNTTIYYPENKIEQQKITSCLSSCDDLIAAHTQKLDALKVYRKGLMQHLFPAAGEKVPSLRFAEFKSSGDWKEDVLCGKEIAFFANEKLAVEKLQLESYVSTENLLADYGGKTTALKLPASGNFTAYKKGDVLFSNIRPYLKKVWFADDQGAASNDVIVIRSGCRVDATFLSFVLKNDYFISFIMKSAEGVKMPRGDKDVIKNFPLTFPSHKEQQKIAFCLTSVDNMITALSEKIALLREHKKGLMQGLFPHIEERN